jgi:hypothetical protein
MRRLLAAGLVLALGAAAPDARQFRAREKHFRCLLQGAKAEGRDFYVFHRNPRRLRKALAIARGERPGTPYPVGTVLQLFPFEAMVKRGGRFNPEGQGWEFFRLAITPEGGTEIVSRGGAEVENGVGSCQGCHLRVAGEFDLVCEAAIGQGGLGLSSEQIEAIQRTDARCRSGTPR